MNTLTITRTNGNVPKSLPGEDHYTGLLAYVERYPSGFSATEQYKAISTIEAAEAAGIIADNADWCIKMLHYQLSEIFRINPAISLYVGIITGVPTTFGELKSLQNFANGKLRQIGIWNGKNDLAAADITALQGIGTFFENAGTPCTLLYAPRLDSFEDFIAPIRVTGQKNVSCVIGQDGSGTAYELFTATANATNKYSVSVIGIVMGMLSKAAVNESISWVKKFPSGVSKPAFADGTALNTVDQAIIDAIDTAGYIFLRTYPGLGGSYINDSHTLDLATSDYATIESVRTMDKAVRGITTYMLPELGSPLQVDAETGKLSPTTVAYLETVAGKALEDMEKAGELSGYSVEIDPEQNVLSTSEVEVVIKQVAVGVMRKVRIKIGFTTSL